MLQRKVDGGRAPHRASNQNGLFHAQVPEQVGQVVSQRKWFVDEFGLAKPAMVVAYDPEIQGKPLPLRVPHPRIGYAGVQEDQGVAGPRGFKVKLSTARRRVARAEIGLRFHEDSPLWV